MIFDEVLIEKYKVQKKLSENSTDMHDYFTKTHESAEQLSKKYGVALRYRRLSNKQASQGSHLKSKVLGI